MTNKSARLLGTLNGRKVYSFPVEVTFGETAAVHQVNHYPKGWVTVTAYTAADAANLIADALRHIPCVEVAVVGTKGGLAAHRYWGFESAIFTQLCEASDRRAAQLSLFNR